MLNNAGSRWYELSDFWPTVTSTVDVEKTSVILKVRDTTLLIEMMGW